MKWYLRMDVIRKRGSIWFLKDWKFDVDVAVEVVWIGGFVRIYSTCEICLIWNFGFGFFVIWMIFISLSFYVIIFLYRIGGSFIYESFMELLFFKFALLVCFIFVILLPLIKETK